MITAMALILGAQGEMPLSFAETMNNAGQKDILMQRNTQINTRTYGTKSAASDVNGTDAGRPAGGASGLAGGLEASINSNVIGKAHIAWQSFDPSISSKGRHQLLGRSVEDLIGVFSIEKFIQLWSGSRPGEISVDWLPCS